VRGAVGGGVGEFKGLFDLEIGQSFDFQDAAGEDILLALLDDIERNGIDQVAQRNAALAGFGQAALEADEHGFRHVERHDAGGGGKGDQTGTGREGDADREAGMRVTTGTDGIRQQQAVQPGVDDAVARMQRNAATRRDKARQGAVGLDVNKLGIGRGMAEGLHDESGPG